MTRIFRRIGPAKPDDSVLDHKLDKYKKVGESKGLYVRL